MPFGQHNVGDGRRQVVFARAGIPADDETGSLAGVLLEIICVVPADIEGRLLTRDIDHVVVEAAVNVALWDGRTLHEPAGGLLRRAHRTDWRHVADGIPLIHHGDRIAAMARALAVLGMPVGQDRHVIGIEPPSGKEIPGSIARVN
ncbi:hypothetical protein GCD22_00600 [Acidithiobacillus thiooxidans ATCC 19377]|uniref:Uncharacterized protein n=1 Tax=Acidithiobacillus thiooxidans ATCC 19377 TaxID=637390 RepID=A0A5P9XN31_ACITH|nr:hypothetical protein GCD22_00600 [Acidithiobacillus thiooxidans ATCC 19377]